MMTTPDRDCYVPFHNPEGYPDPTTHAAVSSVLREQQEKIIEADSRCNLLIKAIKNIIDLAGFDLLARIEVRDRKTGRNYR